MDEYELFEGSEDAALLGSGAFGKVLKVVHKGTETVWAMKTIEVDTNDISKHIFRECCMGQDIDHINIVRIERAFMNGNMLCLVMKLYSKSLSEFLYGYESLGSMSSVTIKDFMRDILQGLAHCHSIHMVHRDLKTGNLLIDDTGLRPVVKISDFGLSRGFICPGMPSTPRLGTPVYMAPEVILGSSHYSYPVDMWAVGCIFGEIVLKRELFQVNSDEESSDESKVFEHIVRHLGTPHEEKLLEITTSPEWEKFFEDSEDSTCTPTQAFLKEFDDLGESGRDLLLRLLCLDPSRRITAREALEHDFLRA